MSAAVDPKIEVLKIRVRQSSVLMERLNHLHNVIADQFQEIAGKLPVDPQPSPTARQPTGSTAPAISRYGRARVAG